MYLNSRGAKTNLSSLGTQKLNASIAQKATDSIAQLAMLKRNANSVICADTFDDCRDDWKEEFVK